MKDIILIPSLNPDERLVNLAKEIFECGDFDLLVINDGSSEEYDRFFNEVGKYGTVLSYRENKGKGHALKYGFKYIHETYKDEEYHVVCVDSDGQHTINDARKVLEESHKHKNALILGSRKLDKNCPFKSRLGNWIARTMFKILARKSIYDTQTGLRAFDNELIELISTSKGERYEYEMNMLLDCVRNKIEIIEVDIAVIYIDNNSGSHYNPLKDTMKIFFELFKFSLSSLIGFGVDIGLYSLFTLIPTRIPNWILVCNVLARIISASVNFTINYKLVFNRKGTLLSSLLKYASLAIFILGCNTGILWILTSLLGVNEYLAKILVEVIMFTVSFLVQRFFVFALKKEK